MERPQRVDLELVEIFSSVQGEAVHLGESTLFVRFGRCDLRCRWCDSPETWPPPRRCRIQTRRWSGTFREVDNPLSPDAVLAACDRLEASRHRFVSLTGGEPLLQPEGVFALAAALRARGPRIHLETHGLAVDALERVIGHVDVVAMDWKLASDVRPAQPRPADSARDFDAAHQEFLRVARQAPEVVVKVVLTPSTRDDEIATLCERIAEIDSKTPVVLQPVTPFGRVREAPSAERVLALAARLEGTLSDVRVIPQTHKLFGAR